MQETLKRSSTSNADVRQLSPEALWKNFADLNAIPRASKNEAQVIKFIQDFGAKLGLPVHTDKVGNVIIKKPAFKGMENRVRVALQSHLDMVHQKNAESNFDFSKEGINMYVDGDWVKAEGTTLGADNGIGVASIMTLLASKDIAHPPLEALFTIDEETGMTGALGLEGGLLDAKILLNLDTEEDNELTIGCAGGIDVTIKGKYKSIPTADGSIAFKVQLKGLAGGHSGMDIHKGRANANKIMNRFLREASTEHKLQIHSVDGGSLRNAIPRESVSVVALPEDQKGSFFNFVSEFEKTIKDEYRSTDPSMQIIATTNPVPDSVLDPGSQKQLINSIYACPNGIYRMSPDIPGLVQTSNNVARILIKDGEYSVLCLTRSSINSEKLDEANAIRSVFELIGADVSYGGQYPGWAARPDTSIVKLMTEIYKELFEDAPKVNAVHAGLECGILGTNYPEMEMISFGPNIHGAHSPDEKVQISSVNKYWKYLLETLKRIPSEK
ncbi:MAG TPA: aminoacyl-histidine dipeptidase [Bacteroidia bacterium]|nr:aminoacyl-histidine dipeptidase [Bacteroidia bacterium]